MKEPVLQDKQQEHVKFCKYANELLERVLGKKSSANLDASLEDIRRVRNALSFQFSSRFKNEKLCKRTRSMHKPLNFWPIIWIFIGFSFYVLGC